MFRGMTFKRLIIAGGTLLCALVIGYGMQKMAEPPIGLSTPDTVDSISLPKLGSAETDDGSDPQDEIALADITLTSAVPIPPVSAPQPANC